MSQPIHGVTHSCCESTNPEISNGRTSKVDNNANDIGMTLFVTFMAEGSLVGSRTKKKAAK